MYKYKVTVITYNKVMEILFVRDTYLSTDEFKGIIFGLTQGKMLYLEDVPDLLNGYLSKLWFTMESVELIEDLDRPSLREIVISINVGLEF
jgi:hypothetical protein